ncbi:MAG: ABC transporter permease [Candidatus Sumerlaeaceae bacterium]
MRDDLMATWALAHREIVGFFRQRSRVAAAVGTPLLFWLVLGAGLGTSFQMPGLAGGFQRYFFPGALLMVVLFSSIFGAISLIEDRREGFLQGVLVAPVSRGAVVAGKVLGGAFLAVSQSVLLLLLALPVIGTLDVSTVLSVSGVLLLASLALSAVGVGFAWRIDSIPGFHGIMNLVLFPMWLFSGALFPAPGASPFIRWAMALDPLSYAHRLLAHALGITSDQSLMGPLVLLVAFGILSFVFAWRMACRRTTTPNQ